MIDASCDTASQSCGGHLEPASPACGGYLEPASPACDGHLEPASPACGGHLEPASPACGGHLEPASPGCGGHLEPASPDCGGHPDPEGICAVRGCTPGDMERCAEQEEHGEHGDDQEHAVHAKAEPVEARWTIPPRPSRDELPPPPPRLHRRWDRTARLLGDSAMDRLQNAHVVVFGMGGVGSYAVEGLARSGINRLTLVDFDEVCITNFNRQLHAVRGSVGKSKAQLMADRVTSINPDAWVEPIQAFYEASTSEALLNPRPDYVVDCIDNVTAKLHLLATCYRQGIPVVSSMGAAAKLDPTRIKVADLGETHKDPLAKAIRKNLGKVYDIDCSRPVGITAVFSDETVNNPLELAYDSAGFLCVCPHKADSPHSCEKRSIIHGTAVFVTSVFGMTAASVVVRHLAGQWSMGPQEV